MPPFVFNQQAQPTGPRLTRDYIESVISSEHYFTAAQGVAGKYAETAERYAPDDEVPDRLNQLTFCVLVLKNGFTVTGESSCAASENFNAELSRVYARDNAVRKVRELEGYLLRQRISTGIAG